MIQGIVQYMRQAVYNTWVSVQYRTNTFYNFMIFWLSDADLWIVHNIDGENLMMRNWWRGMWSVCVFMSVCIHLFIYYTDGTIFKGRPWYRVGCNTCCRLCAIHEVMRQCAIEDCDCDADCGLCITWILIMGLFYMICTCNGEGNLSVYACLCVWVCVLFILCKHDFMCTRARLSLPQHEFLHSGDNKGLFIYIYKTYLHDAPLSLDGSACGFPPWHSPPCIEDRKGSGVECSLGLGIFGIAASDR